MARLKARPTLAWVLGLLGAACTPDVPIGSPPALVGVAAHVPDTTRELVLFALGDAGTGDANQHAVADAMERLATSSAPAFALYLGDNFYENGLAGPDDPLLRTAFDDVYDGALAELPFYPVLGNHDYQGDVDAQVGYGAVEPRWRMPARAYDFETDLADGTRLAFFALDTPALLGASPTNARTLDELSAALARSEADWRIVFGHHPLHSGGRHRIPGTFVRRLEPVLVRGDVDLYLAGHDHDLQLLAPPLGYLQIVSGAGGRLRSTARTHCTVFAAARYGFARLSFARRTLVIEFFDRQGDLLHRSDWTKASARGPLQPAQLPATR